MYTAFHRLGTLQYLGLGFPTPETAGGDSIKAKTPLAPTEGLKLLAKSITAVMIIIFLGRVVIAYEELPLVSHTLGGLEWKLIDDLEPACSYS